MVFDTATINIFTPRIIIIAQEAWTRPQPPCAYTWQQPAQLPRTKFTWNQQSFHFFSIFLLRVQEAGLCGRAPQPAAGFSRSGLARRPFQQPGLRHDDTAWSRGFPQLLLLSPHFVSLSLSLCVAFVCIVLYGVCVALLPFVAQESQ
jgi:hypothetical protein